MNAPQIKITSLAAFTSLVWTTSAFSQAPVPIVNAGFEDPVLGDGSLIFTIPDWTQGNYEVLAPGVWSTGSMDGGVYNPSTFEYASGAAAEGENVGFTTSISGFDSGISQILTATLQADAQYDLSVKVGNPSLFNFGTTADYRIELLAGGVLLQSATGASPVDDSAFATASLSHSSGVAPAQLGEALEIRLLAVDLPGFLQVDYDDVQLTVILANPAANPGGAYNVNPGGVLSLDGSGSLPSGGQSLTSYEWDLDNNGTFGDLTGATPAGISFSDLESLYGMTIGDNTIQLRVSDDSLPTPKTSTASGTVTLALASVTAGADFEVDASLDTDGDSRAEDLTGSGFDLNLDDSPAVTVVAVNSSTKITQAYEFPGGSINNEAGALPSIAGTATQRSFQEFPEDWSNENVTIEFWFKPDNLAPAPANGQILFEDGGGTGFGFFISNNELQLRKAPGGGIVAYDLSTDPSGLLLAAATSEFIQAVGTYDVSAGAMELFVNGVSVGTATPGGNDWSGGDAAGVGTRGDSNVGGIGGGQQNTESLDGQVAIMRVYRDQILTRDEIADNFAAVSGPDLTPPTIAVLSPADNSPAVFRGANLVATFSEEIAAVTGIITLKNLTAMTQTVIPVVNFQVTISENTLIINPIADLAFGSDYAIQIAAGAVQDLADTPNSFAGILDDLTWTFTTSAEDLTPPVVTGFDPLDDTLNAQPNANLVVTFDEGIIAGTGNIVIKNLDAMTDTTIPVTDATQVSIAGNVLTIDPASDLDPAANHAIQIEASAIQNFSGVAFAGINDDQTWNFTVSSLTTLTGSDGIGGHDNWNVGTNWDIGVVPAGALETIIATGVTAECWNAATPAYRGGLTLEENATLQIGWTNGLPASANALGTGPITMNQGSQFIPRDPSVGTYDFSQGITLAGDATIWGGISTANHGSIKTFTGGLSGPGKLTYKGVNRTTFSFTSANHTWSGGFDTADPQSQGHRVWVSADGAFGTGDVTINKNCTLHIRSGTSNTIGDGASLSVNGSKDTSNLASPTKLILDSNETVKAFFREGFQANPGTYDATSNPEIISGSGVLTITGPVTDATAPTVIDITSPPALTPIYGLVTVPYTVTFDKDIDGASLDAGDFRNLGTATFTVGTIMRISDPIVAGVYLVEVTPTSPGTLQLQLSGAINDTRSPANALATPFDDDAVYTFSTGPEPARETVSFDGFFTEFSGGNPKMFTFDASGSDKLVVVVTGEHNFPASLAGDVVSITYDGVALTQALEVNPSAPTLQTTSDLWYLDDPGLVHASGTIVVSVAGNGNNYVHTAMGLSGTAPGIAATASTIGASSVDLITSSSSSFVLAWIGMGGSGNTASPLPGVMADSPPGAITIDGREAGANYGGHALSRTGGLAPASYTFSFDTANTDVITLAAEFLGAEILGGNNFADWIALFPEVGALNGFTDDADGDGNANGLENFFGTNPNVYTKGLEVGTMARTGNTFTFTHPQTITPADDILASYQWSTDLETFHADGATVGGTTVTFLLAPGIPADGIATVAATIEGTVPPTLFVNVQVSQAIP